MSRNAKVISFINMKGGVGKTTLCIGIGVFLARYEEKKILFIDLDPQFNTTQSLMSEYSKEDAYLNDYRKENRTVKKILESVNTISETNHIPKKEDVVIHLDENIDIIPGTIDLILEDNTDKSGKIKRIRKFIKENKLNDIYDYILIDCPPTVSLYTDAALSASDYYLVPNRIDRYSMIGINLLKHVINRLEYNEEIKIKPLGIVYTMNDGDTKKVQELKSVFEELDIVKEIGIFTNETSYVKDLLVGLQGNISSKYKKSGDDIQMVSKEFIERIEELERSK